MVGFNTQIEITDTLVPGIGRAIEAATDFTGPMAEIRNTLLFNTQDRFGREIGPDGVPWKKSQRAIEDGGKTLFDRGDLFNALDGRSDANSAEVGIDGASGGPAIYGPPLHHGATIRPKTARALRTPFGPRASITLPARPIVGISDEDRDEISEIMSDHLRAVFGEGGAA